jgi:hypothetical protein
MVVEGSPERQTTTSHARRRRTRAAGTLEPGRRAPAIRKEVVVPYGEAWQELLFDAGPFMAAQTVVLNGEEVLYKETLRGTRTPTRPAPRSACRRS